MKNVAKNIVRTFGWKRDLPDMRDIPFSFERGIYDSIRSKVDLRDKLPPVYDQGALGSCTANALCSAFDYSRRIQSCPEFEPSRIFLYYNERKIDGTIDQDGGSYIRTGMKSINADGICKEELCPYQIETFKNEPSQDAYNEAQSHKSIEYRTVNHFNLRDLKSVLSLEIPITFGFSVYNSFMDSSVWNPALDIMPMPKFNDPVVGGHAVLAVGYDDSKQAVLVRNSWGTNWGDNGYFWMPYRFISSRNCADFWSIVSVASRSLVKV